MVKANQIRAETTASIADLRRDPVGTVARGNGSTVAILAGCEVAFYCIPAEAYETMLESIGDAALHGIANARRMQKVIGVRLEDL